MCQLVLISRSWDGITHTARGEHVAPVAEPDVGTVAIS